MADRYWVGGTGTWDTTTTTNWSDSSGGPGGASAPTSVDDVFFDSASNAVGYTVTIGASASCKTLTMAAPASGVLIWAGTGILSIFGSLAITAANINRSYNGIIQFRSTTTGNTIDTGGLSFNTQFTFNGIGGEWTQLSSISLGVTVQLWLLAGTLNSNTFSISAGSFQANSTNTRAWNLGSGTHTLATQTPFSNITLTGLTFNAQTSLVRFTNTAVTVNATGLTFNNVEFTLAGSSSYAFFALACNTLTFPAPTAGAGVRTFTFTTATVCTINTLVLNGSASANSRTTIIGNLSIGSVTGLSNVDFQNSTISGAAAPLSGTNLGDMGNNTGVNFAAAKTCYYVGGTNNTTLLTGFAASSGGTGVSTSFPIPQDTVIIDNNSGASGVTLTSTTATYTWGFLNTVNRTSPFTLSMSGANLDVLRDITLSSSINITGTSFALIPRGPYNSTFTRNSATIAIFSVNKPVGFSLSLTDAFTTSGLFEVFSGTLNTNNFNLNIFRFFTGVAGTINLGTSTVNVTGNNTTILNIPSGTFTAAGVPTINCTYSGSIGFRAVNSQAAVSVNITAGTDIVQPGGSFRDLNFTGFSGILSNTSVTVFGNYTLSPGMSLSSGASTLTFAATSGVQLITTNGKTLDFPITINGSASNIVRLIDNLTMGSTRTLTLSAGTFDANNKNVSVGKLNVTGLFGKTLTMGSGTWTLSGTGSVFASSLATNLTFSACPNIILSDNSTALRDFTGTGLTFNTITIGGTGSSTTSFNMTSSGVIGTLSSTKTVAHTIQFENNPNGIINNWNVTGTAGNIVTVQSNVNGATRTVIFGGSKTTMDYMSFKDITFSYTLNASNPYRIYAGANSTNEGNNSGIAFIDGTNQTAYRLTSGTSWSVPADWNNSNNAIHMIGAGGGGGSGGVSVNNRAAGGGGGGGGYTVLTNQTLSGVVPYTIGTSATNANGGNTTFNTVNIAGGGLRGNATTVPSSSGGAGGTGTFAGGTGGAGSFGTVASTGYGAGGGGGAGGPNGVGGNGGAGFASTTAANIAGGGGGGNGGGSVGVNASSATGGAGGNNFGGTGGGVYSGGTASSGTLGGGGSGGVINAGGSGGSGIDINNTIGGSGGRGGTGTGSNSTNAGLYGGGGPGSPVTTSGTILTGAAGSQGVILIVYTPIVVYNNSFFSLFESTF